MKTSTSLDTAIRVVASPNHVMRRVVDQALLIIPGAVGAVIELADGAEMVYFCCSGSLVGSAGLRLEISSSLSGLSVELGETLRCDDARTDPRVNRVACERVGAISMVCVPLRGDDEVVGVLKVVSPLASAFDKEDVVVLATLAEFITVAVGSTTAMRRAVNRLIGTNSGRATGDRVVERTSAFVANVLQPGLVTDTASRDEVVEVLRHGGYDTVFQPVVHLHDHRLAGVEALTRFSHEPVRPPDEWMAEARRVGLGDELELGVVRKALSYVDQLPAGCYVAINLGPESVANPECWEIVESVDPERLVIELTEHVEVEDYPLLRRLLLELRRRGVRLAVDDTGSGFASLSHIVKLAPDIIKLDMELVRGIDLDPVRQSLATALVTFAANTGAVVTAEGIESEGELRVLRELQVDFGQGYLLGRPVPVGELQRGPASPSLVPETLDLVARRRASA